MVEVYADGAGLEQMETYAADSRIAGFTTNPSLMRKAGITNYRDFAQAVLRVIGDKPVSFEVLADDFPTMDKQAREIASWGQNVWVKVPITNTQGESSVDFIKSIADLNLNITAVMTGWQYCTLLDLRPRLRPRHIVSVFTGRIMDTGKAIPKFIRSPKGHRLLWASAREIYNVVQAEQYGYDIITLMPELIAKLDLRGKDLAEYSLETVKQFHNDGKGIEF